MLPWWAWAIAACCRSRAALAAENLCLRQQLLVLRRRQLRPRLSDRSTFLNPGQSMVPGLARHPHRRECGYGATLAPSRLEGLLALAVQTRSKGGSPPYCAGATGLDPTHGRRKSIVGTAKDPSRIGETRVQSVCQNRRQVRAATHASKAITGLAVIHEATRSDHLGV